MESVSLSVLFGVWLVGVVEHETTAIELFHLHASVIARGMASANIGEPGVIFINMHVWPYTAIKTPVTIGDRI